MRVIFAGGGTAGHINPALAIAGYLKEKQPDTEILYIGNKGGMEERLVPNAGFKFTSIHVSGFKRSMSPKALKANIQTVCRAVSATSASKKIIKEFAPDLCIGTGGYVSGPVLKAANELGIPILIHEQNAFPGVANKMLSKKADAVMLAIEDARKHMKEGCNFVVTGNPVRREILLANKMQSRKELGLDERPVVLSFGGSLGAQRVNEALAYIIARSGKDGKYQHIHAYGQYGLWFPDLVKKLGTDISKCSNLDIREYIDNMPVCLAAADVVVCRAGAITISEIQAQGKPAVFIPSPNVAENHQYHNAMALVNKKAGEIIEESELTGELLAEKIDKIVSDKDRLAQYSENARKMAIIDANERIYKVITDTYNKSHS
ncbi:MAG: undecaprenyldiphospho-muramoylpentapeptide beta-N-acetylglucosaminyltransferase [Acutalibacteraceae bacterium]|nr:undecaprenyldiphospho-muramoylpentapeptide beta-N-acetylglucosaminyltransferase [Clostridia bacterium]MEE3449323.1 undecaprenyldiphospho-muramoylpentapeptide beta-N-acetylglucosaminyltransferase [Acutalibacteraceae bacterium]